MKRVLYLSLLLLTSISNAQIEESFDDINSLTDYKIVNASDIPSGDSFYQGDHQVHYLFPAYEGSQNSYIVAENVVTDGNTVNLYLLTPLLTIENGDVISFATRTHEEPMYPDRLEVRIGDGTDIDPTSNNVGSYTNLLYTVNPNLNTSGYPNEWELQTITVSGLSGPVQTRVALRYWVTDAGTFGNNGDFIAIDSLSVDSDLVLSTNDLSTPSNFYKFYNQKTKQLILKADTTIKSIEIYNTLGQKIMSQKLANTEVNLNLSSISNANYIVNVSLNNGAQERFKLLNIN